MVEVTVLFQDIFTGHSGQREGVHRFDQGGGAVNRREKSGVRHLYWEEVGCQFCSECYCGLTLYFCVRVGDSSNTSQVVFHIVSSLPLLREPFHNVTRVTNGRRLVLGRIMSSQI